MLTFTATQASRAIVAFFGTHSAALPDHTRAKLTEALVSSDGLGAIITTMEALYAARADLDDDRIELLGGLARFVGANNFYGKGLRGALIAGVAARIANGGDAEDEGDPAIEPGFGAPAIASHEAGPEDFPLPPIQLLAAPPVEAEGER